MSFHPNSPGFDQSLLGAVDITKFSDQSLPNYDTYYREKIGRSREIGTDVYQTVLIVIITAIIFIIIVSYFDVIRNIINSYYISKSLRDSHADNNEQDIIRTEIGDQNGVAASVVFAAVATVLGLCIIFLIMSFLWRRK